MTCQEFAHNHMDDFLEELLTHDVRGQVESHLSTCKNCSTALRNHRSIINLVKRTVTAGLFDAKFPPELAIKIRDLHRAAQTEQPAGQVTTEQKSLLVPYSKTLPTKAPKLYSSYFANCPRDATGHCLPKGQDRSGSRNRVGGSNQAQLAKAGGTGEPPGGNTFVHARNVLRQYKEQIGNLKEQRFVHEITKAVQFLRGLTKKFTTKIMARYGKSGGLTILATGQALGWGSFVVSTATGTPIFIPGSTILGSLPAVAIAEAILQLKQRITGKKSLDLSPTDAERIWKEFQGELTEAYQKWLGGHSEIVDELGKQFHNGKKTEDAAPNAQKRDDSR